MGVDDRGVHHRRLGPQTAHAARRARPGLRVPRDERIDAVTTKTAPIGYRWHLRMKMAEAGMFATSDLLPHLAERGVALSREQVYRLVARVPERLNLKTLAALCDILDCEPGDLIEPIREQKPQAPKAVGMNEKLADLRPRRTGDMEGSSLLAGTSRQVKPEDRRGPRRGQGRRAQEAKPGGRDAGRPEGRPTVAAPRSAP